MFQDIDFAMKVLPEEVWDTFGPLLVGLKLSPEGQWSIAGSVRRLCAEPKDLDLVVEEDTEAARSVLAFARGFSPEGVQTLYPEVKVVDAKTIKTGVFRLIQGGAKADIRICPAEQFGACLLWLTGPREFNQKLATAAEGNMLNYVPHGLTGLASCLVNQRSEEDVYRCITSNAGVDLPPELPLPQYRC